MKLTLLALAFGICLYAHNRTSNFDDFPVTTNTEVANPFRDNVGLSFSYVYGSTPDGGTLGQEASGPLETRTPASYVLVFNTGGLTTGVALANGSTAAAAATVNIYDDLGTLLQTGTVNLSGHGHTSFLLPDATSFPTSANKRGMVEFVVPQGGQISAIGLRATGNGTLTTIPVLTK